MKVYVLLKEADFMNYLELRNLANCPENFQNFLKTVGTTQISFSPDETRFIEAPEGCCIRLRTNEDYTAVVKGLLPKEDKSRRSSSCVIV